MADTTPTLREAAQQALEALENFTRDDVCESSHHSKADRHGPLSECPVAERFVATVEGLRAALAEQAAEQADAVPHVTDDMRSAVRWAPSSAYWSTKLTEFFGPDAREGIRWIEQRLRDAESKLAEQAAEQAEPYTYASTQSTKCASCGERKHTPLRIDAMGGYVCLTCIDKKLGSLLGEFGHPAAEQAEPVEVTPEMLKAGAAEWLKYGEYEAQFPLAQGFDKLPRHLQVRLSRATHVYRAMRAAAPPAPARQEWQPIETAPIGRNVIVAAPMEAGGYYVEEAWFSEDSDQWWPANVDPTDAHGSPIYPTLWQPLPAAPITAAPAEGGAA